MAAPHRQPAEFSRPIAVDALSEQPLIRDIEAGAEERAAVAERLGLLSVERLWATARLWRPAGGSLVRVRGRFEAEVTQACVVTLAPVRSRLEGDFAVAYVTAPEAGEDEAEVAIELDREDPPEPLGPQGLDLGEAVVQHLAVVIDPYPRAPGARLARADWDGEPPQREGEESPFRVLEALRRRE